MAPLQHLLFSLAAINQIAFCRSIASRSGSSSCKSGFLNTVFNIGAPRNAGWPGTTWSTLTSHGIDDWSTFPTCLQAMNITDIHLRNQSASHSSLSIRKPNMMSLLVVLQLSRQQSTQPKSPSSWIQETQTARCKSSPTHHQPTSSSSTSLTTPTKARLH